MNLHAPERQAGESHSDYSERRKLSQVMTAQKLAPTNPPHFRVHIGKSGLISRRDEHRAAVESLRARLATTPKFVKARKHKPAKHTRRDALGAFTLVGKAVDFLGGVPRDPRYYEIAADSDGNWCGIRKWRAGEPVHNLNPNRERDPGKRTKPKSAVAKRMDRPHRVAMMERGHAKLMRAFGTV